MPTVQPCRWSWDLMPPDVFRPLASLHLGTLIILAHRMGLVWRVLRPTEGVVQAGGNGQSISGTPVRGLGMVIHYDREATAALDRGLDAALAQMYKWIPTTEADKMGFGIIPGGELCNRVDLKFGQDSTCSVKPSLDVDVIFPRLINLGITRRARNHLRAIVKESDVRIAWVGRCAGDLV